MYAGANELDAPPPGSQFRRPWSPDPHDPFGTGNVNLFPRGDYERWVNPTQRRREPSEVSVEALDLADYAMTLRHPQSTVAPAIGSHRMRPQSNIDGPYPPFQPDEPDYPPIPSSGRPFASRTSLPPPSLVSGGESSSARTRSHRSYGPRTPSRRPYSLPPAPYSQSSHPPSNARWQLPYPVDPRIERPQYGYPHQEVDISSFPSWSQEWYSQQKGLPPGAASASNPYSPTYPDYDAHFSDLESNATHRYSANSHAAYSDASHRNLLPWSGDPVERPSLDLDPSTKEERVRMLEAEFMGDGGSGRARGYEEAEDVPKIGSVDAKGNLVSDGPRKRVAVRVVQGLLALGTAVSAIYGALFIKPSSTPPPQSSLAAFVLYGLSVVTTLLILYLFVFRPCCCAGRRKPPNGLPGPGPGGMMVLPVQGLPGNKGKQKGKKGRPAPQDVQVNLIVDPSMFNRRREDEEEQEEDVEEAEEPMPGTFPWNAGGQSMRPKPKRKQAQRRSIFAGLALEQQWLAARKFLRWVTAFDSVFMVLWATSFVLILIGKRCPAGQFEGWCTTYNLATATGCLLCVAFGVALFFDVKDLHASRQSPRTRT